MTLPEPETFLYFAYGSNMLSTRLLARTPSAAYRGNAVLRGYELRWHMASVDGSGKCDMVTSDHPEAFVAGVLYEIALSEKPSLDQAETLGVGYSDHLLHVETPTGPCGAWAYIGLKVEPGLEPYDWYHAIVVAGAREHGLPAKYIAMLEAAPRKPDPDPERTRRHLALIDDAQGTG